MVVAVPLELLASPLKNGRPLGGGNRSALVIGGTEKVRTGGTVVFCKVAAVAEAQVKRDGQVRAKGSPVHHATLGPLEERLESEAGPGVIGRIAAGARLDGRFAKGERERLLAAAFMIRVIVLMTLMPGARIEDVIVALAGDLALGVVELRPALHAKEWHEALAGLVADGKTTPRGAPKNPLQLGATFWHFRHESRITSPPIWMQNLMLPPLWALAKTFGIRPYYQRWDSRIAGAD